MSNSERIVRLISVDKRYNQRVYPSIPIKDESSNTFLTGQHVDPRDPKTKDNITFAEMTHQVPISPGKMAKFPYVIFPEVKEFNDLVKTITFPLKHGDVFNLTTDSTGKFLNPKDKAMYDYCKFQYPVVAMSKKDVRIGETMFYMQDLAAEAEVRVQKEDLIFEAQSKVRGSNLDKYRELALLLNYNLKNFNINVSVLTETQVKDKLIQACKDHPQQVLNCFSAGIEQDLFILKLTDKKIITKKNGSFYDGNLFLGQTVEEVKAFMGKDENEPSVTKWGRLIENN